MEHGDGVGLKKAEYGEEGCWSLEKGMVRVMVVVKMMVRMILRVVGQNFLLTLFY